MSKTVLFALLALVLLAGCTQTDSTTVALFTHLKEKYTVEDTFSPNPQVMSGYISDLSKLQTQHNTPLLRFELYSAQTFYYLLKANELYDQVDYQTASCTARPVRQAYEMATFAKSYATKAMQETSIPDNEKQYLRLGQIESIQGYLAQAQQIQDVLTTKCGTI